jgi:formylglycine-generating enzyme required for sulfatase activity
MFGKAIVRGLLAVTVVLATSFVQGQTHAPWPTDWNNWSDSTLWVPVGDPGNVGELSGSGAGGLGMGTNRICGSVGYSYNIGKYEVTAGQYTAFLTAVAKTDTYGLYDTSMWSHTYGCKIQRSGTSGNYTYSVASDYANRPVNYVSYWDSCRFANWLQNGQPTGSQGTGTTETGAYTLTTGGMNNNTIVRNTNWKYAVTSEDEWYKAAYYKGGGTNTGYWDYPTSSDTAPGRDMADASGNNTNYIAAHDVGPIDPGKHTTLAGEFQLSDSPYGTFDQGGNVYEWNEEISGSVRGVRGGAWFDSFYDLAAAKRTGHTYPADENYDIGFRVASVPEPGSITLVVCGALVGLICWRRRMYSSRSA